MPTVTPQELARLLEASGLRHAARAASHVRALVEPIDLRFGGDTRGLLSIYRGRARHLAGKEGAHARQLREASEELCENLEDAAGPCAFVQLSGTPPYRFMIVLLAGGLPRVLGCLPIVSRLDVDEETWERLWEAP